MWHRRIALALALLAPLLLAASGLGVRAGLWPFRTGFGMFAAALVVGLAGAGLAAVALAVPRLRAKSSLMVLALLLGLASAAVPLDHVRRVKTLPYINDITTDSEHPPPLSHGKPYERHFAELQRIGYPELHPLELAAAPARAFARARAVRRSRAGRSSRRTRMPGVSKPSRPLAGSDSRTTSPCASRPPRTAAASTCARARASAAAISARMRGAFGNSWPRLRRRHSALGTAFPSRLEEKRVFFRNRFMKTG